MVGHADGSGAETRSNNFFDEKVHDGNVAQNTEEMEQEEWRIEFMNT